MRYILLSLCLFFSAATAHAHQSVELVKAYAFDTTPGMANGAVYVELFNKGPSEASLIGATSDIAANVQLHDHFMDGDLMRMMQVEQAPVMGDDETLTMAPGGMHIMLLGLTRLLNVGDTFTLTLQLDGRHTRDLEIEVEVFGIEMRDELVGGAAIEHEGMEHEGMDHESMATEPGEMDDMEHGEHGS